LNFDSSNFLHLKNAAASTQSWAKTSTSVNNLDFDYDSSALVYNA